MALILLFATIVAFGIFTKADAFVSTKWIVGTIIALAILAMFLPNPVGTVGLIVLITTDIDLIIYLKANGYWL
jgi:hypothetical protein